LSAGAAFLFPGQGSQKMRVLSVGDPALIEAVASELVSAGARA